MQQSDRANSSSYRGKIYRQVMKTMIDYVAVETVIKTIQYQEVTNNVQFRYRQHNNIKAYKSYQYNQCSINLTCSHKNRQAYSQLVRHNSLNYNIQIFSINNLQNTSNNINSYLQLIACNTNNY
ncbi:unnamed protein product [Paramecium sonneborni]|uniref:Uncharacterized protein n=1 Tax=Paramecium sonneborni TaxID=65129 RepID=A0A8S1RL74_9CILI|nr:unnamed protein product [Paramecium sonneborni]